MKSLKRWTAFALAMSVVAALMVPAVASASRIEEKPGVLVPVGANLKAESSSVKLNGSTWGTFECSAMSMSGTLTVNNGSVFESQGPGAWTSSCTNNGNALSVEPSIERLLSKTAGKGTAAMSFVILLSGVKCTFSSTATPFSYALGSSSIAFLKAGGFTASPVGCGSLNISGEFQIKNTLYPQAPLILN